MKRLLIFTACLIAALGGEAQTLTSRYSKQRPVVMVCDWDKAPYEYLNDKGEPAGSNIDAMRAVMKELGVPIRFVMKEWSIALKTFERGDADIIIANGSRYPKDKYCVSENIVNYNRIRVATHADSARLITFKQLLRDGAVFKPGDFSAYYFSDSGDSVSTESMEFQTPKVALLGVINGDYKYYVWGEEPLKWKIKEHNLTGITLIDAGIPISEVHVIGRDQQLIEQIDDQYSRLKQRGDIAIIQDRWFHPERVNKQSDNYLPLFLIGFVALMGMLYFFYRLARRNVELASRTLSELNDMMLQALRMGNFVVMEYDIANDRFTNRYGDILPAGGLTLEEFTARIHPDQQQEFQQKMRALMEGRERRFELDKRWNAGTDEPRWLNFNGHAISELDSDGHPAYVVNAIHDVTQEMEEDKAARDLVHKYQTLTNVPFVAMAFYDQEGFLINFNDSMRELCCMDGDNDSQRFWESVNMFDLKLFRNICFPGFREDIFFCQHMDYPELGIDKYIECNIQPLFNADGDIANYYITTVDISQDQQCDREVHLIEKECRETQQLIDLKHDYLYYLLKNSHRYVMRSSIEKETIGFYLTPGQPAYLHSFMQFHRILDVQDREPVINILNDTETRTPQTYTLHLAKPSEGQPGVVFSITFNPIFGDDGAIIGHEGIASDITTLVHTRRRLSEESERAAESVRMKSAFMASMTHELRTPLNAIVGFTGVLEAIGDTPERGEYVRIIRNSCDMLHRLISDIIESSAATGGGISIKPADVDFTKAFLDICLTLSQRVQDSEVAFLNESPYEHFHTTIDLGRVQQVLTNFVTNAVKFTKKGHIRVGYRYERHGLYLFCEDTGIGIPKDKQRIVFDRFVKLDEFAQGTGMGLAICKQIAEACNGEIGVVSDGEGHGSTFWMWIPCERRLS